LADGGTNVGKVPTVGKESSSGKADEEEERVGQRPGKKKYGKTCKFRGSEKKGSMRTNKSRGNGHLYRELGWGGRAALKKALSQERAGKMARGKEKRPIEKTLTDQGPKS